MLCFTQELLPLNVEQTSGITAALLCLELLRWTSLLLQKRRQGDPEVPLQGQTAAALSLNVFFSQMTVKAKRKIRISSALKFSAEENWNPFRPLAAQLFPTHRQSIKPWCDKNIGSRSPFSSCHPEMAGCSLGAILALWASWGAPEVQTKDQGPEKHSRCKNAFTSVNFVNCLFQWPWKNLSFYVEKLLTELWVAMDAVFGLLQTLFLTVQDFTLSTLLGL